MVSLFGLERVIPYKGKAGRGVDLRRDAFRALLDHMERIEPLGLASSDRWQDLRRHVEGADRQVHLDRIEDEVDAIFCAHLAWLWWRDRDAMRVYGDLGSGFIVTPPPPSRRGAGGLDATGPGVDSPGADRANADRANAGSSQVHRPEPPSPRGDAPWQPPTVSPMPELTPQLATAFVHQSVPAIGRLGVVVDAIGPGAVELRVPIEGNANHMGTMYAGALFALAELPGGLLPLAVLEPGRYVPIVTDMQVQFVAVARTDVTLTASMAPAHIRALAATADADGSAEFVLELHAEDAGGRTVLTSRASYQLRPART
jgi:acyl-coenzyme A thioesterase PaaI-like protein